MTFYTKLAAIFLMIFTILCYHPLTNSITTISIAIVSLIGYALCSRRANEEEKDLKSRIKELEDKLNERGN